MDFCVFPNNPKLSAHNEMLSLVLELQRRIEENPSPYNTWLGVGGPQPLAAHLNNQERFLNTNFQALHSPQSN